MTRNFRTNQLNRGRSPEPGRVGFWNGRAYQYQPGDEQVDPCYTRSCRPGVTRDQVPEADAITPHPDEEKRRLGWTLAWIFKLLIAFGLLGGGGFAFYRMAKAVGLIALTSIGIC